MYLGEIGEPSANNFLWYFTGTEAAGYKTIKSQNLRFF